MNKKLVIKLVFLSTLLIACDGEDSSKEETENSNPQISIIDGPVDGGTTYGTGTPKYLYIDYCDGSSPRKKQILSYTSSDKLEFNAYAIQSAFVPKRQGFMFEGFTTDLEGKNLLSETETTTLANNSTLYAQWTPVSRDAYVLDETTNVDRNLGVQTLPIPSFYDSISFFIPYHFKKVMINYAFKSDKIAQTLFASTSGMSASTYNFHMDIPVAAAFPSEANVYNMRFLNVNYTASDYHNPYAAGQTTTVGYSVRVGAVTEYREAMIKVI